MPDGVTGQAGVIPLSTSGGERRNAGLDVARALAIVLVLLSHWVGAAAWWLGYGVPPRLVLVPGVFGVELFFALSGFLIGTQLLTLIERGPTAGGWWRFMVRRWMRTLPLYWLCVAGAAVLMPPQGGLLRTIAAYATLTQNLLWPMPPDNWFGVSWSLSVEEWFYLLFSAVLIGAVAFTRRRGACVWATIAVFVAAPTLLRWHVPDAVAWGAEMRRVALLRLDAMTYGVLAAKLYRDRSLLLARPLWPLAVGMAILAAQVVLPGASLDASPRWLRVFYLTGAPLAFALCLPAATRLRSLPRSVGVAVRYLSVQSYALYLVHLVLIDALSDAHYRLGWPGSLCLPLSVVGVFGVSFTLNRWVEYPIMAIRPPQYRSQDSLARAVPTSAA